MKKLDHFNGEYIRALPQATFVRRCLPWLELDAPWPPERFSLEKFERLAPLVQERVRTLGEVPGWVDFVFLEQAAIDEDAWEKVMGKGGDQAGAILDAAIAAFTDAEWSAPVLHDALLAVGEGLGLKLNKAQAPVRVAITGRTVGPPLFESLEVLGRDVALERLRAARERLS